MNTDILWFLKSDTLIFDIGGNRGINTELYLAKECRVVTVEPQPHCVGLLQQKFKDNSNVVIIQKAISNFNGSSTFCLCNTDDTLSTMVPEKWKAGRFKKITNDWNNYIDVNTVTLDTLIQEYGIPFFCKIDTEGYEYEVLAGLSQPVPHISFEYTYEFIEDAYKCIDLLLALGYKKFNMTNHLNRYVFNNLVSAEHIKEYKLTCPWEWGDIYAFL